jgi:hypothetical protein
MPYEFVIDVSAGVIRETWTGEFTFVELMRSSEAEWAHPDYRKGLNLLCDFRRAKGRLTADEVLKFASWFCNEDAPPKLAIVVRRERAFDFACMFSMIRECDQVPPIAQTLSQTRLFFSMAEAEGWIGANGQKVAAQCDQPQSRTERIALNG